MSHQGNHPPKSRVAPMFDPAQAQRFTAYRAVLAAERALELAGMENEARTVRKIRVYAFLPDE